MTQIEIVPENSLPEALLTEIFDFYQQIFERESATAEHWIEHADYRVLISDASGQWLSTLEIHRRTILVDGVEVQVGGIGGVATLPQYRGQGYAEQAMRQAVEFIRGDLKLPFGMLFCFPNLVHYYERLGWQRLTADLIYRDSTGSPRSLTDDMGTMIYTAGGEPLPAGVVDLSSYPW